MIIFADGALADLERIFEFNAQRNVAIALDHIEKIQSAVTVLNAHPQIGRRISARSQLRELVISHGRSGYIALYQYSPHENLIHILGVRHQHELGYDE